jgi:hypothetical protein
MKLHIFHLEGDEKPWVVAIQTFEPPNPAAGNQILVAFETLEEAKDFKRMYQEALKIKNVMHNI